MHPSYHLTVRQPNKSHETVQASVGVARNWFGNKNAHWYRRLYGTWTSSSNSQHYTSLTLASERQDMCTEQIHPTVDDQLRHGHAQSSTY